MLFKLPPKSKNLNLAITFTLLVSVCTIITTLPLVPKSLELNPTVKASFSNAKPLPVTKNLASPDLTAQSVFIADMESGVVLYAKNPNARRRPASLTKIMTSIVAMDYYQEDSILKVGDGARAVGSTAELKANDSLKEETLLYALLVSSGNDAAVTLAENYPGGYNAFIQKMNEKVAALGLINTHFANVSGVESKNHFTSAYDITQMALFALKRPLFRQIVSTKKITLKSEKGFFYPLESTNELLGKPGIYGVKTGWTPSAGECLVTYVNREDHPIVISVLGSEDRFGETEKLVNWVYENYSWE